MRWSQSLHSDAARRSRRRRSDQPQAARARGLHAPADVGRLFAAAARHSRVPARSPAIVRTEMNAIGGAGVPPARPAPRRALAALRPLGADGRGDVPAEGPPRSRHRTRHDARGGLHDARRRAAQLPAAPADLVPDPDEVPRRAAPEVRAAARARVHHEGFLFLRPWTRPASTRRFERHFEAYRRIFSRCGLETLAVEASSGAMGGSESVEFMLASDAGEDWIASCAACGYAANVEKATVAGRPRCEDASGAAAPERFATPGVRTIEDLAALAVEPARPTGRSRRSSTGSTARRCWCCCAAIISWWSRSCATRPAPPRRVRPRMSRFAPRSGPHQEASAPWA